MRVCVSAYNYFETKHAYEATTSDCIARYARTSGKYPGGVYFITGSDEHGQKIATTAEKEGRSPLEVCNSKFSIQNVNQKETFFGDVCCATMEYDLSTHCYLLLAH